MTKSDSEAATKVAPAVKTDGATAPIAAREAKVAESKKKALEVALAQIDKQYGQGSIMLLGQSPNTTIATISTGSLLIDEILGVGGFPAGRIVEIFGPESTGKSTLALQAIACAQRQGGICAFIDAEHALDSHYASRIGIQVDDLVISQPDYGEQALDIVEMLVRSGAVDMIVVDSVAALVPKAELDGDMGDVHVGLHARLMSQAMRKLTSVVSRSKTSLVFINQIRHNISAMAFANKEVTTGGNALKFYSSMRIEVRKIASLRKNDHHFGNRLLIKVVKNKLAPPFRRVEVDLIFGEGISRELDLLDAALKFGLVKQSGAWLSFDGKNFAQGREQALNILKRDRELAGTLYRSVKKAMGDKRC